MDQEKIGRFIAQSRKQKKLTQQQLAEILGVSTNAVSKWERGICLMDMSLLKPLSETLGVTVNDILSGEVVEESMIKEKADENIVEISKLYHLQGIESGALAMIVTGAILIICSLIKGVNAFGFMAIMMSFSATVSYKKYKLLKDKSQLFYVVCYSLCTVLGMVNYLLYVF